MLATVGTIAAGSASLARTRRTRDRLLAATVILLGLASAALLVWLVGEPLIAAGFLAAFAGAAAIALVVTRNASVTAAAPEPDWGLVRLAADGEAAVAVTDRRGRLVCANERFARDYSATMGPTALSLPDPSAAKALADAARVAWREGEEAVAGIDTPEGPRDLRIVRAGWADDHLVWRFTQAREQDALAEARQAMEGGQGESLSAKGLMTALTDAEGRLIAANRLFARRMLDGTAAAGIPFDGLFDTGEDGLLRARGRSEALPFRDILMPIPGTGGGGWVHLLVEERTPTGEARVDAVQVQDLLAMLPIGLALADRDGRFLYLNKAFRRSAGLGEDERPVYASDLVVKEDKGPVSDLVRRLSGNQLPSRDLAVRLKHRPDETAALTVAAMRGFGEAGILLSLKDNAEELRLKRQVAQATKMQAVGQLAGGVAHDFNNILTAIIGHCDLILMRHTPGDSDYDDIQQIKHNSNRAAGLTRQLLAFSRQQTLRPQVLQLPDVISEVSNLLKRLLGESMSLTIKHGRNLGAVRADPGQLEQVIVNLAVNARDAMPDGGTLTITTCAVTPADVRALGNEVLPPDDYTSLSVTDTGTGIPPEILPKIFEPFFTTKEVGKGTGLGLSTVYGIVKQSGGYIFAEPGPDGVGTTFTLYLPVHRSEARAEAAAPLAAKPVELWGSGNILLVEDEDMVRAVAERALVRQGYKVRTAANGEEALEILLHEEGGEPFDLLISDVVMPSMDGPTMVAHARKRFPELPILFMSGYAEEQLRQSIDLDHVAFLPKPFSVQELAEAARDALAQQGAPAATAQPVPAPMV